MEYRIINSWVVLLLLGYLLGCGGEPRTLASGGIELVRVTTLGSETDHASPHPFASVTAWTDGTFVVAPTYDDGVLHVYSNQGALVDQLGGPGEGPGEFSSISIFTSRTIGQTLWVSTQHDDRLTSFPSLDGAPRVVTTPWPILDFIPVSSDQFLYVPFGPSKPSLSFIDPQSEESGVLPLPEGFELENGNQNLILGPGRNGRAWLVSATSGQVVAILGGEMGHVRYSVTPEIGSGGPDVEATPTVYAVWEDANALWMLIRVTTAVPDGGAIEVGFMDRHYDTRILAFDPETGEVVGRVQEDRFLIPVWSTGRSLLSHVLEDGRGDTRIDILEVRLDQ